MQPQELRAQPRYAVHFDVDLVNARAQLITLPMTNISAGGAFLSTPTPEPAGGDVALLIQPSQHGPSAALALSGRVVHAISYGMGIQFAPSTPSGAALLAAFLENLSRSAAATARGDPPVGKVLAAARTLFHGIESSDPFGALGLPMTASPDAVAQRIAGLTRLFSTERADLTPPQRARFESALRAVSRLQTEVAERAAALRRQAELVVQSRSQEQALALQADAAREEKRGDPLAARRLLVQALALATQEDTALALRKAITRITENLDTLRARDLLNSAEVFVDGVGMRDDAIRLAREAARLSAERDVRLRALRTLAKAGETDDAIALASALLSNKSDDPLALQALLHLHERAGRLTLALRAGQQLARQRPDDRELAARLARLAAQLKKAPRGS